ncbi:hypothetical protein M0802_000371 [Mischocyttarus mexicanus]|nr:hypothetical protein M0802_000371 [Mischocyttarus mexicanus]
MKRRWKRTLWDGPYEPRQQRLFRPATSTFYPTAGDKLARGRTGQARNYLPFRGVTACRWTRLIPVVALPLARPPASSVSCSVSCSAHGINTAKCIYGSGSSTTTISTNQHQHQHQHQHQQHQQLLLIPPPRVSAVYFLGDEPKNDGNDYYYYNCYYYYYDYYDDDDDDNDDNDDETKLEVMEEEYVDEIDDKETLWDEKEREREGKE